MPETTSDSFHIYGVPIVLYESCWYYEFIRRDRNLQEQGLVSP
jgi:hypothetical protein